MDTVADASPRSLVHLYVMQNAWGLIKVGRSRDPERRRRDLESESGCRIALVAVLAGKGHRERALHSATKGGRLIGEWFAPTIAVKAAIKREFGCKMSFPYQDASNGEAARQSGWIVLSRRPRAPRIPRETRATREMQEAVARVVAEIRAEGARKRARRDA